jgi:hypothetical protein
VTVTYLWSADCPSHREGVARLRDAAERAGVPVVVEEREVTTDEEAGRLGFLGSPTYLLDGRDMAAPPDHPVARVDACRAYPQPGGRVGPLPHPDDLVAALLAAARDPED